MKTAISIPDETFQRVERGAHDLGVNRSEFFTRAATHYLDALEAASITRQINDALDAMQGSDESASEAVLVGHRVLDDASGEW